LKGSEVPTFNKVIDELTKEYNKHEQASIEE
jgi:hypothetical protein